MPIFSIVSSTLLVQRSDRFSVLSYSILKARTGRCNNTFLCFSPAHVLITEEGQMDIFKKPSYQLRVGETRRVNFDLLTIIFTSKASSVIRSHGCYSLVSVAQVTIYCRIL